MGRPRAFDEDEAVQAAAGLFATRGYEGTSVDDLVTGLGVHRGSLYKVFGSKRGLYLTALRRHLDLEVLPVAAGLSEAPDLSTVLTRAAADFDGGPAAGLLLSAAVERAGSDPEVAALVAEGVAALDRAIGQVLGDDRAAGVLAAAVLGLRMRARAGADAPTPDAVQALAERVAPTA
ncbi:MULTISPECIES: TetR/AcrR family transcriptional regulator [unclassified Kitasatospora]|uniref:TetR/AcrR family transcriptional regulator n=1 Tax=unclassified Kitasatospora TaxID=2633591 RepID=UPI001ADFBCD6|nr:TetR/AcrR family transcriptional regulator [Kitasatospora sp. RG8]MBP0448094.1 TetR/AcrR family transcriptional regulator [Kitasatospora sp. RG8]